MEAHSIFLLESTVTKRFQKYEPICSLQQLHELVKMSIVIPILKMKQRFRQLWLTKPWCESQSLTPGCRQKSRALTVHWIELKLNMKLNKYLLDSETELGNSAPQQPEEPSELLKNNTSQAKFTTACRQQRHLQYVFCIYVAFLSVWGSSVSCRGIWTVRFAHDCKANSNLTTES